MTLNVKASYLRGEFIDNVRLNSTEKTCLSLRGNIVSRLPNAIIRYSVHMVHDASGAKLAKNMDVHVETGELNLSDDFFFHLAIRRKK